MNIIILLNLFASWVIGDVEMNLKRRLKAFFPWPLCFGKRSKQRKQEIEVRKNRYFLGRFIDLCPQSKHIDDQTWLHVTILLSTYFVPEVLH